MLIFKEFCAHNNVGLIGNVGAERVYSRLTDPEAITKMTNASDLGLPALSGIARILEDEFEDDPDFPLGDFKNRQQVGRMIKHILGHFGYVPEVTGLPSKNGNTALRDFCRNRLFRTGAIFKKTAGPAEHTIVMKIV